MEEKYLPLGSIVKIVGISDFILIIGVHQISEGETYQYSGCVHPYGYVSAEKLILFNSDVIEEVVFRGYYDDETKEFFEDLDWLDSKEKKEGN